MNRINAFLILLLIPAFGYSQQKKNTVKFDASFLRIAYMYSSDDMDFYAGTDPTNKANKYDMPIISITTLASTSEAEAKSFIDYQKNNDAKNGAVIQKTTPIDTVINGRKFYALLIDAIEKETGPNKNVYGFLYTGNTAFIFLGSDMGKHKYFSALLKTFYSMKP